MHSYSFASILYRGLNKLGIYLPKTIAKLVVKNTKRIEKIPGAALINLDTYDGSKQAVHPDVISTGNFMGYKYWMAVTPYPFSVDHFENPSIFKSRDGILWEAGASNPIVSPTRRGNAHLSDPDLIWEKEAEQLRLFYRETQYQKQGMTNFIFTTTSKDGAHWTPPVIILQSEKDLCLSPSAVRNGDKIEIFYVSTLQDRYRLKKKVFGRNFKDASEGETICQIDNVPAGRFLWHIDIIKTPGRYLGLFVFAKEIGDKTKLFFGTSRDCGLTWDIKQEIVVEQNKQNTLFRNIYRGCLVPSAEDTTVFHLYFSAQLHDRAWYVFYRPGFETGKISGGSP